MRRHEQFLLSNFAASRRFACTSLTMRLIASPAFWVCILHHFPSVYSKNSLFFSKALLDVHRRHFNCTSEIVSSVSWLVDSWLTAVVWRHIGLKQPNGITRFILFRRVRSVTVLCSTCKGCRALPSQSGQSLSCLGSRYHRFCSRFFFLIRSLFDLWHVQFIASGPFASVT